jgi:polysaccharide pyruvyl transferase WcaK-like protein
MGLLEKLTGALDPDKAIQLTMDALIEKNGLRYALDYKQEVWKPGKPLKILLAGYTGSRNTGSDIRPEEMIRQFRTIWGDDQLEISILTIDRELTAGYFRTARQVELPLAFPRFLAQEVPKHHAVIGVEGSMFKSKFANAVTTMIASALGLAAAENKPGIGYGAEAGAMDANLRHFVENHCKRSLVICRNEPSRTILEDLGVRTTSGTDTAWTFCADTPAQGAKLLQRAGWDGKKKVIGVGPINPFWWPVRPDLMKSLAHRFAGQYREEHYRAFYFHQWGAEERRNYDRYIEGFADYVKRLLERPDVFPILFGMEQLDRRSCEDVRTRLGVDVPLFISDENTMYQMVSVLHNCSFLVSSRFHALVTSMLGSVPSAGVTMDERITNLLNDRGHNNLLLSVTDDDLGARIWDTMAVLEQTSEKVVDDIRRFIPKQLSMLGQMGMDLEDEIASYYPEFPRRDVVRTWENYLPPSSPNVQSMLEQYG